MDVKVPKPFSHQMIQFYELEDLFVFCRSYQGKELQEGEDFVPVLQVATGEFTNDIRVTHHLSVIQQSFKVGVAFS